MYTYGAWHSEYGIYLGFQLGVLMSFEEAAALSEYGLSPATMTLLFPKSKSYLIQVLWQPCFFLLELDYLGRI